MEVFLARQPIFNSDKSVYAYELLYRSNNKENFNNLDDDSATANVIVTAFQTFGINLLTHKKPAFINFTENVINQEVATIIPKDAVVIEILETVEATESVIEKCKQLKAMGYTLALDDFVYKPEYMPLIGLADIIKIDFLLSTPVEIARMALIGRKCNVTLLAEKVETQAQYEFAKRLGFSLFQGYFFCKPEILAAKAITPLQINQLQLIKTVNQREFDFGELAETIAKDVSLVYSLLRLMNSAALGFRQRITSIKHALALLGEDGIRKWISLLSLQKLGENKPNELVRLSLIRAKFAESLAENTIYKNKSETLFLAGLFSLLDVILDKPMETILNEINAPEKVKACLLDNENDNEAAICKAILSYEKAAWDEVWQSTNTLNIDNGTVTDSYLAALQWYEEITTE